MNNLPLILLALAAVVVGAVLVLSTNPQTSQRSPETQNLRLIAEELSLDSTSGRALYDSTEGTLAYLRQLGPIEPHIHHESHEVLYVLSGSGTAQTSHGEYELSPRSLFVFFAGSPVIFEQTGDEPLDTLIFLTPPSDNTNVSRYYSVEVAIQSATGALEPLQVKLNSLANESAEIVDYEAHSIAQFAPTGSVKFIEVENDFRIGRSSASTHLLYIISGSGTAEWSTGLGGRTEVAISAGELLTLPAGKRYTIRAESPMQMLQYVITAEIEE